MVLFVDSLNIEVILSQNCVSLHCVQASVDSAVEVQCHLISERFQNLFFPHLYSEGVQ